MKRIIAFLAAAACLLSIVNVFAEGEKGAELTTSKPTFLVDMTDATTYSLNTLSMCEIEETDDGILFTAKGDDPAAYLIREPIDLPHIKYAAIRYRCHFHYSGRKGEIYFQTEETPISENKKISWEWENDSGEWDTTVVKIRHLSNETSDLEFLRLDPIASGRGELVEEGESIEIAYVAFFDTEDDAKRFDLAAFRKWEKDVEEQKKAEEQARKEEERKKLGDWQIPAYQAKTAAKGDNQPGSLKYTENGDGTVTVSYLLNGKTVSYTVPDLAQYTQGGFGGADDTGRALYTQYSEINPDYTTLDGGEKLKKVDVPARPVGVLGDNGEHYVGVFYFLWAGEHGDQGIHNIESILEKYGDDAANHPEEWGGVGEWHHFAEPLYGYYYSRDRWVMRKHMELLGNAGVDFLYFDTTNTSPYVQNALALMAICHELNEQGIKAPKVCFYTNSDAKARVKQIYKGIYEKNLYPDTWFTVDGKPLIIAPYAANIDNFFTVRQPQWPNADKVEDSWPWIDWNWAQEIYGTGDNANECVNVSVAQHSGNSDFSSSALYGYKNNRGRSFDGTNDKLTGDSYKLGLNLQNEFNFAIAKAPKYVTVTGWNEWVATRQERDNGTICFIDTASFEYSRDMEMSKGGYFDNYYMQLCANVQALKGAAPVIVRDGSKQINVTGDFSQWEDVVGEYTDFAGDTAERDCRGWGDSYYRDDSGRNDIRRIKVTHDTQNLYFYVECGETIQRDTTGGSWLNIFLNVGSTNGTGAYGYNYLVNGRQESDLVSTLARCTAEDNSFTFEECGRVNGRVLGNQAMFEIPLRDLGITNPDRIYVQFKVCDSKTRYESMEDFYVKGDTAPLGRLNYIYQNYIPGVTAGTEKELGGRKGCGSLLAGSAAVAALAGGACLLMKKKEEKK